MISEMSLLGIILPGVVLGVLIGSILYLFGMYMSALGQLIYASLDTAVNSSPFLDDTHRAQAMSLPVVDKMQSI